MCFSYNVKYSSKCLKNLLPHTNIFLSLQNYWLKLAFEVLYMYGLQICTTYILGVDIKQERMRSGIYINS